MTRRRARLDLRWACLLGAFVLVLGVGGALIVNSRLTAPHSVDKPATNQAGDRSNRVANPQASPDTDVAAGDLAELDRVEDFSRATDAQLGKLAQLLSALPATADEQLAGLVDRSFRCGPLRPSRLADVFNDKSLTIQRAPAEAGQAEATRHQGGEGLLEALRQLSQPLGETGDVHVKFKTFSVELATGQPTTQVYYQAHAKGAAGSLQQNATWSCQWLRQDTDSPPRLAGITITDFEEVRSDQQQLFSDLTRQLLGSQASFQHQLLPGSEYWRGRLQVEFGVDLHGHQGLAVGDVNGDDLDDVYVCQPGGLPNRLYLQTAGGQVREAAAEAGIDWLDRSRSALFLDLDHDGDQDLVVALNVNVMLMANDGQGRFVEKRSFFTPGDPTSMCAADFDLDGDLDIYVTGYGAGFLAHQDDAAAMGHAIPFPYHDANNGGPNLLLRNDGDWHFTDVTAETGLDQNNRRWSFAASWEDYDNDGDPDLYVANDYGRNNLYRNDGGRFVDAAAAAGVEDIAAGMSVSWGDYDADGLMDVYVGNMFSAAGNRIAYQRNFQADAGDAVRQQFQRHARGNTLFKNNGDGTFRDVSIAAGVFMGRWAWGSKFIDLNNDGHQDLFVGNGYLTGDKPDDL